MAALRLAVRARTSLALGVLLGALVTAAVGAAAQPRSAEYAVKAAFLYNFAKFVAWPEKRANSSAFRICIHRPDPFGEVLEAVLGNKTLGEQRVELRRVGGGDDLDECHILFVGRGVAAERVLSHLGDGVLTVGEEAGFLEAGGMIRLMLRDNRVRFAINAAAAQRAGLRISSQLLKLATEVRGVPHVGR